MEREMVSFVIPCYRSAATIGDVVEEIDKAMQALPAYQYEVILVNDCSPDDTFEVIRTLSETNSRIVGVNLARNFGQHAALMAGFHQVKGDILVCLDDDGQTPALEFFSLVDKLLEGYDVVYASYGHKMHNAFRNFGTCMNERMTESLIGKPKGLKVTS